MEPSSTALDLSVRDVFRSPQSEAFAGVETFARRVLHRHRPMGRGEIGAGDRLARSVEARWTLPRHLADGLDVFDAQGFEDLAREWQQRDGYLDLAGEDRGPFVIPVDPVEAPAGLTATSARSGRGRERLRAVTAPAGPATPRRAPAPRERWRSTGGGTFSPYPTRLGQAGRIDGALLRFPEARAITSEGERRTVIVGDAPAASWGRVRSLASATQSAEHLAADVIARATPAATAPVGLWLVPEHSANGRGPSTPPGSATRAPGRWQSEALATVLHAPERPAPSALGAVAQRFLDAPAPLGFEPIFGDAPTRAGYVDFDAFEDRSVVAPMGARASTAGDTPDTSGPDAPARPTPDSGPKVRPAAAAPHRADAFTPSLLRAVRPAPALPGPGPLATPFTSTAFLATQPLVLRAPGVPPMGARQPAPRAAPMPPGLPGEARPLPAPRVLTSADAPDRPGGARTASRSFAASALMPPTTGQQSSTALPRLSQGDVRAPAVLAALAALESPLARRLAADAEEVGDAIDLGHRRYEPAPLEPEYWVGLDVADPTLVTPTPSPSPESDTMAPTAAQRSRSLGDRPRPGTRLRSTPRLVPAAAAGTQPVRAGGSRPATRTTTSLTAFTGAPTPPAVRPMTRAATAPVLLPLLTSAGLSTLVAGATERAGDRPGGRFGALDRPGTAQERPPVPALPHRDAPAPTPRGAARTGLRAQAVLTDGAMPAAPASGSDSSPARSTSTTRPDTGLRHSLFAPLGAVGPTLPLASARTAGLDVGRAADALALGIGDRYPTDETGAWGPRVVLAPSPSALALDAPDTTWVAPVAPAQPTSADESAEVRSPRRALAASTPPTEVTQTAGAALRPTAFPPAAAGAATPPGRRTPTLLSPDRPGLPGVLSPRTGALPPTTRRTSETPVGAPVPGAPPAMRPSGSRSLAGTPSRPQAPATRTPTTDFGETLARPDAAATPAARLARAHRAAAGLFGPRDGREIAARIALDSAMAVPFGIALGTPEGFTALLARTWSATAAALALAAQGGAARDLPTSAAETTTGNRPPAFDVRPDEATDRPTSALAERAESGVLLRSAPDSGTATPTRPADPTREDGPASGTRRIPAAAGRPDGLPRMGAGLSAALGLQPDAAVVRLAGRAVLLPAAAVAALRGASSRPALLGALARLGSPALASLLAADAPEGLLLASPLAATTAADTIPGGSPTAAAAGPHATRASRALAVAGFHEPRGLRTPGPAPRRNDRPSTDAPRLGAGAPTSGPRPSMAAYEAPTLAMLVLPPGVEATSGPLSGTYAATYAPANVDRALVAFEQVAARHPGLAGDDATSPHATASARLRPSASATGGGTPGALATPVAQGASSAGRPQVSAGDDARALVQPQSPPQSQPLFGNRGPTVSVLSANAPTHGRVMVEPGSRGAPRAAGPLRSTDGERPARQAETGEQARHRLAKGQIEESLSPEEVDKIAHEVISQLKRQIELDAIRVGEDEWD